MSTSLLRLERSLHAEIGARRAAVAAARDRLATAQRSEDPGQSQTHSLTREIERAEGSLRRAEEAARTFVRVRATVESARSRWHQGNAQHTAIGRAALSGNIDRLERYLNTVTGLGAASLGTSTAGSTAPTADVVRAVGGLAVRQAGIDSSTFEDSDDV